jgi:hypothetical protein
MQCPPECQAQITQLQEAKIPPWLRAALIVGIGSAIAGWIELRVNLVGTFSTKEEVKEVRSELREDLKSISAKLDRLLDERRKP